MRIKKVEIDGFKSYAQKQSIVDFDAQFNAITGLNGSGKSNILDAICFVLGISNLNQVRAVQLSDLVYKQGQAGVTKATVTVYFDNSDVSSRPLGYEKYEEIIVRRQIVIGGRNTYTINGTAATNSRVADMFGSVGLNVNNPHFLIMQGRITKVLNMKPMEILKMIEEAAGTRMYEQKRQNAVKIIEKKEVKMEEIRTVMEQDILPRVEQLKGERNNYLEYQRIDRDLETLTRKLTAYDYYVSQANIQKLKEQLEKLKTSDKELDSNVEAMKAEVSRKEAAAKEMESSKKDTHAVERKKVEGVLHTVNAELTKMEGERDAIKEKQKELKTAIDRKAKSINSDRGELERKSAALKKLESERGGEEKKGDDAEKAVRNARAKIEALAKGLTTDEEGHAVSLDAQLTAQRTACSELETKVKKAEMRLKQLEPQLAKKQKELSGMTGQAGNEEREKFKLEQDITKIEGEIRKLNFDPEDGARLSETKARLNDECRKLADDVDIFYAKHQFLNFKYTDPYPNFDRGMVKGVLASLFDIRDMRFATALDVAAGGQLGNVVVRQAEVGKELIEHGRLANRITLIPLDKIVPRSIDKEKLNRARSIVGKDNVFLAKDLIEYDAEVEAAMRFVFGDTLICTTNEAAQTLAYHPQVRCRSVTLGGSDFSPSGTLSGGSSSGHGSRLIGLNEAKEKRTRLDELTKELRQTEDQMKRLDPIKIRYEEMNNRLKKFTEKHNAIVESLKLGAAQVLRDEVTEMQAEVSTNRKVIDDSANTLKERRKKVSELEERKKNEKAFQDKEKKQAHKELAAAEKLLSDLKGSFEKAKAALETLREEVESLTKSLTDDEAELEDLKKKIEEGRERLSLAEENVSAAKTEAKGAQKEMDAFNERMRKQDAAIRAAFEEVNSMKKELAESSIQKDKFKKEIQDTAKGQEDYAKRVSHMEKKNKWIAEEKHHFGKAGTAYDFEGFTSGKGEAELEERKKRKEHLERTINTRAMSMLGNAEERYTELTGRKLQLEKDKTNLLGVIKYLDEKKRAEIIKAHERINQDFGEIFSTLLPGAGAKLEPPVGCASALEGLEVKVAFRDKWKDSLGELSGGQRSLVALSLVLAMLKFNPAPIYILDEVDAALDVSHTQNIGVMIRDHFKQSQFIIVSLKDGMFNNANVLYKTRFVDGTSTVQRTENHRQGGAGDAAASRGNRRHDENGDTDPTPKKRKKAD